jgi:hypothetical protein
MFRTIFNIFKQRALFVVRKTCPTDFLSIFCIAFTKDFHQTEDAFKALHFKGLQNIFGRNINAPEINPIHTCTRLVHPIKRKTLSRCGAG